MSKAYNATNFAAFGKFTVSPTPGIAAFTTIQEAIDSASAFGGGFVEIMPGTYNESLTISNSNISLSAPAPTNAPAGPTAGGSVLIQGNLQIDASSSGDIKFSCQNLYFETTSSTPAISFNPGSNSILSSWNSCTFKGTSGTAFDCNVSNGNTILTNCSMIGDTGQKAVNLNGPSITFQSCSWQGADTPSTIQDGKIFIYNSSISDTFDISGSPGPLIIISSLWLALNNLPPAILHNGSQLIVVQSTVISNSLSNFIFESGGAGDAGAVQYSSLVSGGIVNFDPLLTVQAFPMLTGTLVTSPTDSNSATSSFGTSMTAGTSVQNTTGYNLLVNICVDVSVATTATLVLGVGPSSSPTTNTVIPSFTVGSVTKFTFSAIVPNNYFVLVDTTGTITVGSITTQVCPL